MQRLDEAYSGIWDKDSRGEDEGGRPTFNADPEGDFRKHWGWYTVVDEVVNQTPMLSEDEIMGWGVIRFYNRIAYLKEKNFIISQRSKK